MRSSLKLPGTTQTDIRFNDQTDQTTALGFCGSFENRVDSTNPGTLGLSKIVTFSEPPLVDKGITLDSESKITFTTPGSYFMTSQFSFLDSALGGYSNVWYALNSSNVVAVTTTNSSYGTAYQSYGLLQDVVTVDSSGSSIEFYWQPSTTTMTLEATDKKGIVPQKPSAKVSVYKIA